MSWESKFEAVLNRISNRKDSDIFKTPVDWKGLGITDYPLIIKRPMDLKTIRDKLDRYRQYSSLCSFLKLKYVLISLKEALLKLRKCLCRYATNICQCNVI